jgi:hypothetical protein
MLRKTSLDSCTHRDTIGRSSLFRCRECSSFWGQPLVQVLAYEAARRITVLRCNGPRSAMQNRAQNEPDSQRDPFRG